jgi:hypothetical protein
MKDSLVDITVVNDPEISLYLSTGRAGETWMQSRMVLLDNDQVRGHHDINSRAISVDAHPDRFELAVACLSGDIAVVDRSGVKFERIDEAGTGSNKFGYLKRIRYVGDEIYVCGDLRQIYRRTHAGWSRFDHGTRLPDVRAVGACWNDIDGDPNHGIYVVGDRGWIYRFEANAWVDCDSPTNLGLERVLTTSKGVVWTCGQSGILISGRDRTWRVVAQSENAEETLWGLAEFQNEIYTCSSQALYKLVDDELVPVNVPDLEGSPHRLAASDRYLWLITEASLMRFDGQQWQSIGWST